MRGYFQKLGLHTKSIVLIRFKVFKSDIESMHAVLLNYVFVKCFAEQIKVGLNSFCDNTVLDSLVLIRFTH